MEDKFVSLTENIRKSLEALEEGSSFNNEHVPLTEDLLYDDYDDLEEDLYENLIDDLEVLCKKMQCLTESKHGTEYQKGYEAGCFKAANLIKMLLETKYNVRLK